MSILLRRHIVWCPYTGTGKIDFLIEYLRDAKISKFDPIICDKYVGSLEIPMKYPLIVHIEDSKCNLSSPIDNLSLFQFFRTLIFFLLDDELIEISSWTKFHDDVELLAFNYGLAIRYNVDMLESLKQLHFNKNILCLFSGFVGQLHFLYNVVFILLDLTGEIGVTKSAK